MGDVDYQELLYGKGFKNPNHIKSFVSQLHVENPH